MLKNSLIKVKIRKNAKLKFRKNAKSVKMQKAKITKNMQICRITDSIINNKNVIRIEMVISRSIRYRLG
jgi:hypothetical protein